jgi:hypothetical protein
VQQEAGGRVRFNQVGNESVTVCSRCLGCVFGKAGMGMEEEVEQQPEV